ncbi:MAG: GNAT family N-acetyltransferase [Candidatus Korobacteraceae bacterium]
MLIRPAIPEDLPSIRALERQADTAAHWAEREYDALFAADRPPRIALVAVNESDAAHIYGFVIACCATDDWEIENVVVARSERRFGIGTKLIQDLLLRAQIGGATSVLLEVRESNVPARRLYETLGFSEKGRRNAYYRDPPENALMLRISLSPRDKVP